MVQELKEKLKAADKKITELEKYRETVQKRNIGSSVYVVSLINCVFFALFVVSQERKETRKTKATRETNHQRRHANIDILLYVYCVVVITCLVKNIV